MTKNLSSISAVSCNPELSACPPFCDTSSSNSTPPQYCISSKHSGDCFNCPLHDGCKDCQGHEISICLADYLEEPDMILEPIDDDEEPVMILEPIDDDEEPVMILGPVDDDEDILEPMDDDEDPDHPAYCSQNHGDCSTCSLVNYGRDCMNNPVSDREVING